MTEERKNFPFVNITLVAANILYFLFLFTQGNVVDSDFAVRHGAMYGPWIFAQKKWWMMFSAMFYHFSIQHLANNMITLFFLGNRVEQLMGHVKYMIMYVGAGLCGNLVSSFWAAFRGDAVVSGGASGAVFGVIGALLWIVIRHRGRVGDITLKRLMLMLALSLYYGLADKGVDNPAHIGGMLGGFVIAVLLYRKESQELPRHSMQA